MASTDTNTYAPDYAVHPGEILDETLLPSPVFQYFNKMVFFKSVFIDFLYLIIIAQIALISHSIRLHTF